MNSTLEYDDSKLFIFHELKKRRIFVGELQHLKKEDCYELIYDKDYAHSKRAIPISPDLDILTLRHRSPKGKLFPAFLDRIPVKTNPAYEDYCRSESINPEEKNFIVLLTSIGKHGPSSFVFERVYQNEFSIQRVIDLQKKLNMTRYDFCEAFDFSMTTLQKMESGKSHDKNTLKRLQIYVEFPEVALWQLKQTGGRVNAEILSRLKFYFNCPYKIDLYESTVETTTVLDDTHPKDTNTVNSRLNYLIYERDRKNFPIRIRVNQWFSKYIDFMDTPAKDFKTAFKGNYGERLFELVMSDFFYKKFTLKIRSDAEKQKNKSPGGGFLPDLEFQHNEKKYYVEVTSRASSRLNDYLDSLSNFDRYFSVAKIFQEKDEHYKIKYQTNTEWWHLWQQQQNIWYYELSDEAKKLIIKHLRLSENTPHLTEEHLKEFNEWVHFQQYALLHFKNDIPDHIKLKLSEIGFAENEYNHDETHKLFFLKKVTEFFAQKIIDKLTTKYSSSGTPIILVITLSLINDIKMMDDAKNLIECILKELPNTLKNVAREKSKTPDEYNIVRNNMRNLYTVIVDTSHYNWFPDILCASMPAGYSNFYGVIYNTHISDEIRLKTDPGILNDFIPYHYEVNFLLPEQ